MNSKYRSTANNHGVELVCYGQTSTIRENPCADNTLEKPSAVNNPTHGTKLDRVEVKENIYSTIQENLETLDSATDQSDL